MDNNVNMKWFWINLHFTKQEYIEYLEFLSSYTKGKDYTIHGKDLNNMSDDDRTYFFVGHFRHPDLVNMYSLMYG